MVYRITCSCGKMYIRETKRALGTRIMEQQNACCLYCPEESVVAEHAWCTGHRMDWDTVEIVDTASNRMELLVKEVIHIQRTPKRLLLNQDNGWLIPESWNVTLRTDMMSSREARHREWSIHGEIQALQQWRWTLDSLQPALSVRLFRRSYVFKYVAVFLVLFHYVWPAHPG